MKVRRLLKKSTSKSKLLAYLYDKIYLRYLRWKRYNVKIVDVGKNNVMEIPKDTICDNLQITFKGNNNKIKIGKGCGFKQTNMIYIQGDRNIVEIGDDVIFDQNVSVVVAEGTECKIGSGCRFANGVRIRTSDQHFIFNKEGKRINYAKNVYIGNHVWLGASVIIMKGITIGEGVVVGIDSMVTKDIPSRSIAVGKPARVIKSDIFWNE